MANGQGRGVCAKATRTRSVSPLRATSRCLGGTQAASRHWRGIRIRNQKYFCDFARKIAFTRGMVRAKPLIYMGLRFGTMLAFVVAWAQAGWPPYRWPSRLRSSSPETGDQHDTTSFL